MRFMMNIHHNMNKHEPPGYIRLRKSISDWVPQFPQCPFVPEPYMTSVITPLGLLWAVSQASLVSEDLSVVGGLAPFGRVW